jgi:hypothetical protein
MSLRLTVRLAACVALAAGACTPLPPAQDGASANGSIVVPLTIDDRTAHLPAPRSFPTSRGMRLILELVSDARDNPATIGRNVEGSTPIPVVGTGMPPMEFVGRLLRSALADAGIAFASGKENATHVLRLRLVRFYVEEGNIYRAQVAVTAELQDTAGRTIYSSQLTGTSRTWGRSAYPENYLEVLAGASNDLAKSLLEDARFQSAINPGAGQVGAQ